MSPAFTLAMDSSSHAARAAPTTGDGVAFTCAYCATSFVVSASAAGGPLACRNCGRVNKATRPAGKAGAGVPLRISGAHQQAKRNEPRSANPTTATAAPPRAVKADAVAPPQTPKPPQQMAKSEPPGTNSLSQVAAPPQGELASAPPPGAKLSPAAARRISELQQQLKENEAQRTEITGYINQHNIQVYRWQLRLQGLNERETKLRVELDKLCETTEPPADAGIAGT